MISIEYLILASTDNNSSTKYTGRDTEQMPTSGNLLEIYSMRKLALRLSTARI